VLANGPLAYQKSPEQTHHSGHDGRVDSDRKVARVLHDDGGVDVSDDGVRPPSMDGVKRKGEEAADGEADGDDSVRRLRADEHLGGESTPRNRTTVVRLGVGSGPGGCKIEK
jgi:hypothetical protein